MTQGALLQAAIVRDPSDGLAWLALADWLEEDGQAHRADLLRLTRRLRDVAWDATDRPALERRVVELLAAGVEPANPEMSNSTGMRFRLIPPGRFLMGAADDERDVEDSELPRHEVTLTRPFWLGVFPVTQRQYAAVMGTNPSYFSAGGGGKGEVERLDTADFPIEQIAWNDAQDFCRKLGMMTEKAQWSYRLPSEAEWEYACRAGHSSSTPYHFGGALDDSERQANFDGGYPYGSERTSRYLDRTSQVGSYRPNAFGLYDMHGNVWEWTADWYGEDYYATGPRIDPLNGGAGYYRVFRGGGWRSYGSACRAACRGVDTPPWRSDDLGFRVALDWSP